MSHKSTASIENIVARAKLLRDTRSFFDSEGFLEVWTPILSAETIIDRFLEPFVLESPSFPGPDRICFMQSSPEFPMKRLLLSGLDAIYQIAHVFRQFDRGDWHNVEFTMLEWYRTDETYESGIAFLGRFLEYVLGTEKCESIPFSLPFIEHTGLDPHLAGCDEFRRFADENRVPYPESYGCFEGNSRVDSEVDCWINFLFSEFVQPHLGTDRPLILYDYPGSQSQLAQTREIPDASGRIRTVAERFEAFYKGVELANGYNELLDPYVLRERFRETNRLRERDGHSPLPLESRLLAAMEEGLPPCVGVALGFDRLLMLLLGSEKIDEVIPFPIEIA